MPIYDYQCPKCHKVFERIAKENEVVVCECKYIAKRIFPQKSPSFKLTYNPKTDIVDWDGNRSRYWDQYKKDKEDGKKVRIPQLDGDVKK
jgi:putative FmdB family regulatory protein